MPAPKSVVSGSVVLRRGETPEDVTESVLPPGDPLHLPALLVSVGFAASSSAARRDIDSGAVRIDGAAVPKGRYDVFIVDNLMPDVHRRPEDIDSFLHHFNGTIDTGTKSSRASEKCFHSVVIIPAQCAVSQDKDLVSGSEVH